MRVDKLIELLEDFARVHGDDAQISVPRSAYQREVAGPATAFGEQIFIYHGNIATYLDSRGPEVRW